MVSRKRREPLSDSKYPIFGMFGANPKMLTFEQSLTATADQRIESVWRFLVRRALLFAEGMRGQELANFDVEDVLMELYVELREKDHKWEPARGRYITYAARLAQRHISGMKDRARTVQSPRNSSSRILEYQKEADAGTITQDRMRTFVDIARSKRAYAPVTWTDSTPELKKGVRPQNDPSVEDRERERLDKDAITWGLMALTPFESKVLGMSNGLWGQPCLTTVEIAEKTGRSRDAVKKARDSAVQKVKERLLAMGHPAVASEN